MQEVPHDHHNPIQPGTEARRDAGNEGHQERPVFITEGGELAYVLLSFEDYQRLTRQRRNIADALAMPGVAGIEGEPPCVTIGARPADPS